MRSRLLWIIATTALLLPAAPAFAEGALIGSAKPEQKAQAQALFQRASAKFEGNDLNGALEGFRASFEVVKSPNTNLLISRTLASLGRHAEAYREALATIDVAKAASAVDAKYAETEKSARDDAAELKRKIGVVRVDLAGKSGTVTVAGRVVTAAELSTGIALDPGAVDVVLDVAGAAESKRAEVVAGGEQTVSFAAAQVVTPPTVAPETRSPHPFDMGTGQRITAGVFLGLGVVGMGLFAGFGAANQSTYATLEEQCQAGACPASLAADIEDGKTFQTAANGSVIAGSICLAVGAGLLIPTFFAGDAPKGDVTWLVGPGYVGLERSF